MPCTQDWSCVNYQSSQELAFIPYFKWDQRMENWSSELFWGFYYVQGLIWMTTMVFLVQQVELNKQSGRRSEKQKVKINKMGQWRMQKETESVQRHVKAMKAEAKIMCKHLGYKSSSVLFSFPWWCAYTAPAPLLRLLSWQNVSDRTEEKGVRCDYVGSCFATQLCMGTTSFYVVCARGIYSFSILRKTYGSSWIYAQ